MMMVQGNVGDNEYFLICILVILSLHPIPWGYGIGNRNENE